MHFQRDFNKVSQKQFRGVCDQDCTVILLKVPSKWFLATAVGSVRRVTRHMAQILARITQHEFNPLLISNNSPNTLFYFYHFFLGFTEQQRKQFLAYM